LNSNRVLGIVDIPKDMFGTSFINHDGMACDIYILIMWYELVGYTAKDMIFVYLPVIYAGVH